MDPKIVTLGLKGVFALIDHPFSDKIADRVGSLSRSKDAKGQPSKPEEERKPKRDDPQRDSGRELRSSRRSDSVRRSRSPRRDPGARYRPDRAYDRYDKDIRRPPSERYRPREGHDRYGKGLRPPPSDRYRPPEGYVQGNERPAGRPLDPMDTPKEPLPEKRGRRHRNSLPPREPSQRGP